MNILSIIPARSGSKSIPNKNIKLLAGKPLLAYSIEYSKKSKIVSHTIVSTDSVEYKKIALKYGADVPMLRPKNLSGDDIQDFPVALHELLISEKYFDKIFDVIVWLRPTSPLRPNGLIEKGINILKNNTKLDSIRTIAESTEHPFRQWLLEDNKKMMKPYDNINFEPYNKPRQLLTKTYFQTGDIEIIKRSTLIKGSISGDRIAPIIIEHNEMVDIDDLNDWNIAKSKIEINDGR